MKKEVLKQLIAKPTRRIRILGGVLAVFVFTSLFAYYLGVVAPSRANAFTGGGEGTSANPYLVSTCDQLQSIRNNRLDATYVLVNDIDCAATVNWNGGQGFNPIDEFYGKFDGRGYAIWNLVINRPEATNVGLFGYVLRGGTQIRNVWFEKSPQFADRIDIIGRSRAGALVGDFNGAVVANVHSKLNIRSRAVTSQGGGGGAAVGGLIGTTKTSLFHSSSSGTISIESNNLPGRDINIGGLIGIFDDYEISDRWAAISDSYFTGNIDIISETTPAVGTCGGLVGGAGISRANNQAEIINSYSIGRVSCISPTNTMTVGGLAGYVYSVDDSNHSFVFKNSFNAGPVIANVSTDAKGLYGRYFQDPDAGGDAETDFSTNVVDVFRSDTTNCGSSSEAVNDCQLVNVNNEQPDFFTSSNSSNNSLYSLWDKNPNGDWVIGDSFPTHQPWSVMTNYPTNVSVERQGDDFIASWTKPSGDGVRTSGIVDYTIKYRAKQSVGWSDWTSVGAGDVDTYTLSGLTLPNKFQFVVSARMISPEVPDLYVVGLPSSTVEFASGMPDSAPSNITITPYAKTATVAWDPLDSVTVEDEGGYTLEYRKVGSSSWIISSTTRKTSTEANQLFLAEPTATIIDLQPQESYQVRVRGGNKAGSGPVSDPVSFTTPAQVKYNVSTCQQLQDIKNDPLGSYTLTQDINCSNFNFHPIGSIFDPGADDAVFMGDFDGNGKTIENLSIIEDLPIPAEGEDTGGIKAVGIFAATYGASIKNVTIKDSTIAANYSLEDSVDEDQNGLPDAPDFQLEDIDVPQEVPGSVGDAQGQAVNTFVSARDALSVVSPQFISDSYGAMAKVAAGGVIGLAIGPGTYQDIRTVNTAVRGGEAAGIIGVLVPISPDDLPNVIQRGDAERGEPTALKNLHSDGLVIGNVSGGLISVIASPLGNALGLPTNVIIQDSSSSSEVQGNIAGGLVGAALNSSVLKTTFDLIIGGAVGDMNGGELKNTIVNGIKYTLGAQNIIVRDSESSGLVSACESLSGLRLASLGGIVGVGVGVRVDRSTSTSAITNCSSSPSDWGVYGGFMGGIGGALIASRVTDSSSTGDITAINDDSVEQISVVDSYIGSVGGVAGLFLGGADDTDGKFALSGTHSEGDITLDSKSSFVGTSGGLLGILIGSGTIKDSYSESNITHNLKNNLIGGVSVAGGLTGFSVSGDVNWILGSAYGFPQLGDITHGLVIDGSYSKGDVKVKKDGSGGSLAVGGGLSGFMFGQAKITNSFATGDVTGGLPDRVVAEGDIENPLGILTGGGAKYGAAVSGGLVGTSWGMDIPLFLTRMLTGITGSQLDKDSGGGIVMDNTYATGDVDGNLAGGLVGSADMKTEISKSYAEGDVTGAIVGGVVGETGVAQAVVSGAGTTLFGIGVLGSANASNENQVQGVLEASKLLDTAQFAIGPSVINNTYSTGKVTATPGLSDTRIYDAGSLTPVDPIRLPSTAGGIVGLNLSFGGKILNSYASGDITVKPDLPTESRANPTTGQNVSVGKIPSVAGGIVGLDIAFPVPSMFKISSDTLDPELTQLNAGYFAVDNSERQIKNVFSTSRMNLQSQTITGGAVGLFISPANFVDAFVTGIETTPEAQDRTFKTAGVYLDKSRISVSNCSGPKDTAFKIASRIFVDSKYKGSDGRDVFEIPDPDNSGQQVSLIEVLKDDPDKLLNQPFNIGQAQQENLPTVGQVVDKVNSLLSIQTACDFVNTDGTQDNYFKQNDTNYPMKNWDFDNVWKVRENDYPKFVAGASVDNGGNGNGGGSSSTNTTNQSGNKTVEVTEPNEIISSFGQGIARRAGFNRDQEQVKGLKAILARMPVFLARSIPYTLILLLLILASMYSFQALREYRQLSVYHKNILRITNTKASIDNYLAITTHYLNTPAAIMGGAVELLTSLKKVSATKASSLESKLKKFSEAAAGLLTSNQVSNAQSANDEKLIKHEQPSPFKAKAVWIPASIAFGLIALANALFIYADVFNSSPYRIMVEFGLLALGVFLVGLAYRYRNFMAATKDIARHQLAMESQLYKKREAFIPEAIKVVSDNYDDIQIASESLKKTPEAKLFFNGLAMLGGIKDGLIGIKKFASFEGEAPLFDVTTYIKKTIHEQNTKAADKKITFDASIANGLITRIQPEAVKQIVDSIIDNAVKFAKDGGHIEVQAYKRFNQLVFSVSDNGIGISENKLPSLLKPFSRGTESMEYNYEGLGLGLYTDKVIIDKLGGKISISSKLGQGTVVTISLPMSHEVKALAPVLIMPEATA